MSRADLKVVLLGKEFGGKTSLVERYVNHRFIERDAGRYQATIGAAYASRNIQLDDHTFVMAIWDTAGSERYEAMSKMYYRNAKAAIICYDLTDNTSFEKVKFWVQEIKAKEESCRLYLCGTKRDLVSDPKDRRVDARIVSGYSTAVNARVFETSSKTGQGVDEMFDSIARDYIGFRMQSEEKGPSSRQLQNEGNTLTLNDGEPKRGWKCPC